MAVRKRDGKWFIDYYNGRKRVRIVIGASKKLAEQVFAKKLTELAEGKYLDKVTLPSITMVDFSKLYLDTYSKPKKRSWRTDEKRFNVLNRAMGKQLIGDIKQIDIERYLAGLLDKKAPATANRYLALLRNMFNKAVEWNYLQKNPVSRIKKFKENSERMRFLSKEEVTKLLSECRGDLNRIVQIALNTGMRKGEISNLRKEDINWRTGTILLCQTKSGKPRPVPMNEKVKQLLSEPFDFRYNWRKAFDNATKRAGIHDFRFHDLRHTFASYLVMNGVNLKTVMELLGHQDYKMTLRYAHLSPAITHDAVEQLGTIWARTENPGKLESSQVF